MVVRALIRKVPARDLEASPEDEKSDDGRGECDRGTAGGLGPHHTAEPFDHAVSIRSACSMPRERRPRNRRLEEATGRRPVFSMQRQRVGALACVF